MKKFTGILSMIVMLALCFFLAACKGNTSGVECQMTSNVTTKSIELNFTFAANDNITKGLAVPHVKKYAYDEEAENNVGSYLNQDITLSFDGVYTSAKATFDSLEMNTQYVFRLYVTFNTNEELIDTYIVSTKSGVASEITNKDELFDIKNDPSGDYVLKNDIDLEGEAFASIFSDTTSGRFSGTFDGQGHTISNFKFQSSNPGLFGYTKDATIKNLTLDGNASESLVNGDYSASHSSLDMGCVAGNAKTTLFDNVHVKNASINFNGNAGATVNLGGFVGLAENCQFVNCTVSNVTIDYTRLRNNVCTGLFGGAIFGTVKSKNMDKTFALNNCYADGALSGTLYFPGNEGNILVGGFVGDLSTSQVVKNCYTVADIKLYKDETTSNSNKFKLTVGGFAAGKKNGTTMYITNCAAVADIFVQAGAKGTDKIEADLMEIELNPNYTYISGFVGDVSEFINQITDCCYVPKTQDIKVVALASKTDPDTGVVTTLIYTDDVIANKYATAKITNVVNAKKDTFDTSVFSEAVKKVVDEYLA